MKTTYEGQTESHYFVISGVSETQDANLRLTATVKNKKLFKTEFENSHRFRDLTIQKRIEIRKYISEFLISKGVIKDETRNTKKG